MIRLRTQARRRLRLSDACYHVLRLTGWLVVTTGCVAALWLLLFAALGNFSFSGTVVQLENFASRYVSASADRQERLVQFFWLTSAGLFAAVGFFRRHSLDLREPAEPSHFRETNHG